MKIHTVAQKTAAYLAAAAEFVEAGYTVASGVRVKDIFLNGEPLAGEQTVDLLVCDGQRVRVGIACDPENARLFHRSMPGVPCVRLPELDTALPLSPEDETWLDFPSEACLESLLKSVVLSLSCLQRREEYGRRRSLASYRKGKQYTLPGMLPEQIFARMSCTPQKLRKKLAEKQLLRSDFTPTPYGSAHGLFLRYQVDPFGDAYGELLMVPGAEGEIRRILYWEPQRAKKRSLGERISNHSGGTKSSLSGIRTLLNTPVEHLFPNRPELLGQLLENLERSRFLLTGEKKAEDHPVYRDVLETLDSLRQGFRDDPLLDDDRSRAMRRGCEKLLLALAEVFLTPRSMVQSTPKEKHFVKGQSLKDRLAGLPDGSVFLFFGTSLESYYQAISRMSGCDYPNWIYRTRVLPILQTSGKPETEFNLRFLAAYCKVCLEDNGREDWAEAFPLLLDLIVTPVCIKER